MTIDEQRYLLNQDCLLMKYQRGNAMNEPLQNKGNNGISQSKAPLDSSEYK